MCVADVIDKAVKSKLMVPEESISASRLTAVPVCSEYLWGVIVYFMVHSECLIVCIFELRFPDLEGWNW